jgi:hypothetical protein
LPKPGFEVAERETGGLNVREVERLCRECVREPDGSGFGLIADDDSETASRPIIEFNTFEKTPLGAGLSTRRLGHVGKKDLFSQILEAGNCSTPFGGVS